uniref:C2 domain-containing protein n=1 Tax=Oryza meridionalis TaxID=40149 RepID=A0A0E0CHC3_9ORYZ
MSGRHDASAKMAKLKELLHRSENRICADCSAPDPKWAQVLSVTLDQWSDNEIDNMIEVGGNSHANAIYEAFLPQNHSKPHPDSTQEEREKFIRYFLALLICSTFKCKVGMVEFIGILNVKVKGGTNLAIRDMSSSDPYVVLTLGQQKAQTSVIKASLNPVWNEELKLSVPQQYGPLKLQVFDHDMLSKDDLMGEAEIDLQPMINAAAAFGDPELLGDRQIGRWLKSGDNALVRDSAVLVAGGEVRQELALKLLFTESGEVELEMQWIPLNM